MATITVTDTDFDQQVIANSLPVLVDFWAPWCGPCKMAEPVMEELADDYSGKVIVAKVNVDENQATSSKYGIMSIPTTVLFKGGQEIGRQTGFAGKEGFEELVKKAL